MMSLGLNVRPQSCKLGVARSRSQRRVQSCPIVAGISVSIVTVLPLISQPE